MRTGRKSLFIVAIVSLIAGFLLASGLFLAFGEQLFNNQADENNPQPPSDGFSIGGDFVTKPNVYTVQRSLNLVLKILKKERELQILMI